MKKARFLTLLLILSMASSSALSTKPDEQFVSIMDAHWAAQIARNPVFATSLGVRDFDDQLPDPSLAAYQEAISQSADFLRQLEELDEKTLNQENRLNIALLRLRLENEIAASQHGGKYMILTNRSGPHLNMTSMAEQLPFFSLADYQSYVVRLALIAGYMNKAISRLRAGIEAGWVQPCKPMEGYEKSIQAHLVSNVADSRFMEPFANKPTVVDETDFFKLKAKANKVIEDSVLPAFSLFNDFYLKEVVPACREQVGTDGMPGGKAYYAHRVKLFTTTDQTPDQVHKTGLSEVARIKAEMHEVIKQAGFDGSFKDWLNYLRDAPEFYPKTAKERMQAVAAIAKKMDGELPKLFGKLPRMPYGLKEIPLDIAEKTTTAYYQRPAGDGSRAGFYFVNTSLLDTRPLYQLEALSLHEAVPGHHLQIALAQELDLPGFRKFGGQTVFIEGWALYAERLGIEVGFYQTPYTNFGRLSYEMWRACRLVVDTGIHSKGWTRQQAIDYMAENSGLSMNNITSEVDRYITWPGQALAYKIGELKIRQLRARAEQKLGARFDPRTFHDRVLENGALPLSVLEDLIDNWIDAQ